MAKLFFLFFLSVSSAVAAEFAVADQQQFDAAVKKINPGETIILKNGIWEDARLKVNASGSEGRPIIIKAETPGKVVLTGDSRISLGGRYLVVDGLWFQNPSGSESIELRTSSKKLASDCRITNCGVTNDHSSLDNKRSSRFVSIYGSRHRMDHCYFSGKTTVGPTLVVWLAKGKEAKHRIDHNHFGPRPRLGENGGETIRVGDSKTSMQNAACIIEHNLFEKCDGEVECISNKSCGNIYRRNRFEAVSGTLTLRHGNNCLVEDNYFQGLGAKGSGGVRIIGEGHTVTGNRFENLMGDDARSAVCYMLGIPDSPLHGYFQVKKSKLSNNVFLNCKHNIVIGMAWDSKSKLAPLESSISGNIIQNNKGAAFDIRCDLTGVKRQNNIIVKKRPLDLLNLPIAEPTGPGWGDFR